MNGYEKYIPKRASFNDVSILELTEWGDYIDLTMTNISNPDILRYDISIKGENVKPDFLIAVYLHESKRFEPHVAPITLKEILALADIKDGKFVPRIKTGLEEKFAEHIVALTCAAKMFSYQYGRCEMTNRDNSGIHHWQFIRQKFVDGGRVYPIVCEVDMRPANVVVKIPEVKKDSIKYISER